MNTNFTLEVIAENKAQLDLAKIFYENNLKNPSRLKMTSQSSDVSLSGIEQRTERTELQLLLQAIPEYWPGQNLHTFITEVDNLGKHLAKRLTSDQIYVVNFAVRSKIRGEARDYIAYQNASEWADIRRVLLQKYGDQRSEDLLLSSMMHCVQKKGESYLDFYGRLLQNYNELMQNVTLNITDPGLLQYKQSDYEKRALKAFQVGLLEPHRSFLSNFDLTSVEECLNKCKIYDNKRQEWEYSEFLRRSQNPQFPQPNFSQKPQTHQVTNQKPANNFSQPRRFAPHQHQKPNYGHFAPANQNPKPSFAQNQANNFRFFGNRPNFNDRSGPHAHKLPPPEPMSVQSKLRSQQFHTNRPQWTGRPNNVFHQNLGQRQGFEVQELHNIETKLIDYPDTDANCLPFDYCENDFDDYGETEDKTPQEETNENFHMPASEEPNT